MAKPKKSASDKKKSKKRSLWPLVVAKSKASKNFLIVKTMPGSVATRAMMDEIYQTLDDPDGNFLEQFQTTGFDARCFELYLYAYLRRSGLTVDRSNVAPDFVVSRDGIQVALEATTVNPAQDGVVAEHGRKIGELSEAELADYVNHELAIRFGSALFSKLKKRYWEKTHVKGLPLVFAVQAFHDADSLGMSDAALTQYLYGIQQTGTWGKAAELEIHTNPVPHHKLAEKEIPSNFFSQPGAENVSAVVWSNSGTTTKFTRMGYQQGFGNDRLRIKRQGFCFNPDPDAMDPTLFGYDMDHPPIVEPWGQGLVVCHNPTCKYPLPRDFFPDAVQMYIEGGRIASELNGWHPIASKTLIFDISKLKEALPRQLVSTSTTGIIAIPRSEFEAICGFVVDPEERMAVQHGWFMDETQSFLGVLLQDKSDNDWNYVILARDQRFQFRAIEQKDSMPLRMGARMDLQMRMAILLDKAQRIFPQGPFDV